MTLPVAVLPSIPQNANQPGVQVKFYGMFTGPDRITQGHVLVQHLITAVSTKFITGLTSIDLSILYEDEGVDSMSSIWADYVVDNRDEIKEYLQSHPKTLAILGRLANRIRRIWNMPDVQPILDVESDMEDGTLSMIVQIPGCGDPIVDSRHLFEIRQERAREELELMRTESVIIRILD